MAEPQPLPDPPEVTWTGYRQDDNGNRFVAASGLNRQDAERRVAELEALGHKQYYWAQPEDT